MKLTQYIRNRIAEYRKKKLGISIYAFAKQLGIQRQHLGRIEQRNGGCPSASLAKKISEALEVPMDKLFYLDFHDAD